MIKENRNVRVKKGKETIWFTYYLSRFNITIDETNHIYGILGDSSSGKTKLFQILFGLDFDYQGEYKIDGKVAKQLKAKDWDTLRSHDMQIVYQDCKLL